jgi:hypothetical protein
MENMEILFLKTSMNSMFSLLKKILRVSAPLR